MYAQFHDFLGNGSPGKPVPNTQSRGKADRDALLYTDPTVDGLKTGHTDEAGYCLTASAKRGDMRLITVVMGARTMPARADQTRALLNWGYSNFERAVLAQAGASLGTAMVQFGKVDMVQACLARSSRRDSRSSSSIRP